MSRLRKFLPGLLVAGLVAAVVILNRSEIVPTWNALKTADPLWLGAGIALTGMWTLSWSMTYGLALDAVGTEGRARGFRHWKLSMAALAANMTVKSGGLAAVGVFDADAKTRGISRGPIHAAVVLAATIVDLAFLLTLALGLAAIVIDDSLTRAETLAAGAVIIILVLKTFGVLLAARNKNLLRFIYSVGPRIAAFVRRQPKPVPNNEAVDEVFEALDAIRNNPYKSFAVLGPAVLIDLVGVALLWASIATVGGGTSIVTALVVYTVSSLFAMVGFLPGGIGFVEVGATAVLTSLGLPIATAAAAVIVFRLLEFWVPVLIGGISAGHLVGSRRTE